jgi:hypothetical protein
VGGVEEVGALEISELEIGARLDLVAVHLHMMTLDASSPQGGWGDPLLYGL